MNDLVSRLRIKAGMIELGEKIAWGSDSALMREAADALEMAAPAVRDDSALQACITYIVHGDADFTGMDEGLVGYFKEKVGEMSTSGGVQREPVAWSGWGCQYPGKMPRLYGERRIAELNCDWENGDQVLHFTAVPQPAEQHPDDAAVDRFAAAMKAKLTKKRTEGRSGWQDATAAYLSHLLHEHVRKGDPVDVGNLAMMLHQNEQGIEQKPDVLGLTEALRQYQHNDGSGLVFGYDRLLVDQYVAALVEALETALFGTPLDDVSNRDNDDIWCLCYPHLPERASDALRDHLARIETALTAYLLKGHSHDRLPPQGAQP